MQDRPNVLVVMTDEQDPFYSSPYGHPFVQTPHMQRLANLGVTMNAAYCNSPTCVASRASFMTGRFPHQVGVYDLNSSLSSSEPTWAHLFNLAGYETVLCGKMHFIGPDQRHGFQKRLVEDCHGDGSHQGVPDWNAPVRPGRKARQRIEAAGKPERNWWHEYDERVRDETVRYLRKHDGDQPFALCASFISPHFPLVCEKKYFDMYYPEHADLPRNPEPHHHPFYQRLRHGFDLEEPFDPEQIKRCRAAYFGLVTFVDSLLGDILDALDEGGHAENTMVVFTSDHGEMLGERGMWWKSSFLEPSGRVPMICSFPGRLPEKEYRDSVVSLIDVSATIMDVAGIDRPPFWEGESFMPVLEGDASMWKDEAFIEYLAHAALHPQACLRKGRYKFTYSLYEPSQLYDMQEDPDERVDLALNPRYTHVVRNFEREILSRWPARELDAVVRESQQRRRLSFTGQAKR